MKIKRMTFLLVALLALASILVVSCDSNVAGKSLVTMNIGAGDISRAISVVEPEVHVIFQYKAVAKWDHAEGTAVGEKLVWTNFSENYTSEATKPETITSVPVTFEQGKWDISVRGVKAEWDATTDPGAPTWKPVAQVASKDVLVYSEDTKAGIYINTTTTDDDLNFKLTVAEGSVGQEGTLKARFIAIASEDTAPIATITLQGGAKFKDETTSKTINGVATDSTTTIFKFQETTGWALKAGNYTAKVDYYNNALNDSTTIHLGSQMVSFSITSGEVTQIGKVVEVGDPATEVFEILDINAFIDRNISVTFGKTEIDSFVLSKNSTAGIDATVTATSSDKPDTYKYKYTFYVNGALDTASKGTIADSDSENVTYTFIPGETLFADSGRYVITVVQELYDDAASPNLIDISFKSVVYNQFKVSYDLNGVAAAMGYTLPEAQYTSDVTGCETIQIAAYASTSDTTTYEEDAIAWSTYDKGLNVYEAGDDLTPDKDYIFYAVWQEK